VFRVSLKGSELFAKTLFEIGFIENGLSTKTSMLDFVPHLLIRIKFWVTVQPPGSEISSRGRNLLQTKSKEA
jgi:hypothetical protein